MPPPGYEPFLRAICADPEDDTVRLVYADWLDENGDPDRAEFIRLQIALDSVQSDDVNVRRYGELLQANQHIWRDELPTIRGVEWGYFARGFVSSLNVQVDYVLTDHSELIFSKAPITHLVFNAIGPGLPTIFDLPVMQKIQRLSLCVASDDDTFWSLLTRCSHLTNLQKLAVTARRRHAWGPVRLPVLTVAAARPFVESLVFSRLRHISLRGPIRNTVTDLLRTRFTVVIH